MKLKHIYKFGSFRLDTEEKVLMRDGLAVPIPPKDLETLMVLVERAGHIVEKDELIEKVWPGVFIEEGNLARRIFNLRQVLGDSADQRPLIETIPKRGYRFIAMAQEDEEAPVSVEQTSEHSNRWYWAIALTLLVGCGFLGWRYLRPSISDATIRSIAVLPFANATADPEMDYFGEGLSSELTNSFSRLPNLLVMARSTVSSYRSRQDDPQGVGRDLHVDAVLTGRLTRHGVEFEVETELVSVSTGAQLWGRRYTRISSDASGLQSAITRDVAGQLRPLVERGQRELLAKVGTQNADAYQSYLKGRYHFEMFTADGFDTATVFFEKAVALDPTYAVAYAGLADVHALRGYFGYAPGPQSFHKSREAARRALDLDNNIPESHVSLAIADMFFFRNFAEAQSSLQKALTLNPNSAYTHEVSCWFNNVMARPQEAIAECQKAVELEPLSELNNWLLGNTYYLARDFTRAQQLGNHTREINPGYYRAYSLLGCVQEVARNYPLAMQQWIKREQIHGNMKHAEQLERAFQLAGYSGYLKQMAKDYEAAGDFYNAATEHAKLGERDATFADLERAVAEGQGLDELSLSPELDNIRKDPRYFALRRQIGLPSQ